MGTATAWLEILKDGMVWKWHVNTTADEELRHLMQEGLCQAREDIAPDLLMLTPKGIAALEAAHEERNKLIEQSAKKTAERKSNHLHDVFVALIGAFFAMVFNHARDIFQFIVELFHC